MQYIEVTAMSETQARRQFEENYSGSQGFVIDAVTEIG